MKEQQVFFRFISETVKKVMKIFALYVCLRYIESGR